MEFTSYKTINNIFLKPFTLAKVYVPRSFYFFHYGWDL